jgi:hypothetical protein
MTRCARRRALCRQGARRSRTGWPTTPGRAAAAAAEADGQPDPVDDHRHHQFRGRGAAARSAADQALSPALQRAAARRQIVPVHPAARRSRLSADHQASRRARAKGNYYGPFASAGSVNTTINALQKLFLLRAAPTAFFAARPALPALPDQALLGALRRADRRRRPMPSWWPRRRTSLAEDQLPCRRRSTSRWRRRRKRSISSARRCCATGCAPRPSSRAARRSMPKGWAMPISSRGPASGGQVAIQAFFIRGGQNWGHRAFFPSHTEGLDEGEVLTSFLAQFYEEVPPPRTDPGRPRSARSQATAAEALAQRRAARSRFRCRSAATGAA